MLQFFRKEQEDLAKRESKEGIVWTETFDNRVRGRFLHLIDEISNGQPLFYDNARKQICKPLGIFQLCDNNLSPKEDFRRYLFTCGNEMFPSVLEAFLEAIKDYQLSVYVGFFPDDVRYRHELGVIFREHRIKFVLVNDQIMSLDSSELHTEIIAPVVHLLTTTKGWERVEQPYFQALNEIKAGNAGNAITYASTALQQALEILGCEGDKLGPLISSAQRKGILAAHDEPMLSGIRKIFDWVSADRSNMGNVHKSPSDALEDAWFIVHVVGAILVRLNKQTNRT